MTTTPRSSRPSASGPPTDVADEERWTERLDDTELAELDAALRHALAKSDDVLELGRDDFPLPTLHGRLLRIEDELINGRGFVRLRGVDRRAHTQAEMEIIYWGIGTHLGLPWAQNKHGHVLGDVTDQQKGIDDPTARGNELGGIPLPFHCDGSDLVGLMCLENGRRGGLSAVANSVRIHNRLVAERPDLAAALYDTSPTTSGVSRPPAASPITWCPSSPSGRTGCSSAAFRLTSWRRNVIPNHPASPTCRRKRWERWSGWPTTPRTMS